jgi:HAD superfamily hydrolase (TIGR01549 family)
MNSKDWWIMLVLDVFEKCNISLKEDTERRQLADSIYGEFATARCWSKYEHCDAVLEFLKSNGFRLGVVSNFDERLQLILASLNILKYFDFVCIPALCEGLSKPNKEIFLQAFKLSNCVQASQVTHVGDDLELDFKTARNKCGMGSILLMHNKREKFEQSLSKELEMRQVLDDGMYAFDLNETLELIRRIYKLKP